MSIDPFNEKTIPLTEAADRLDVTLQTIHQWRKHGVRGVKLEFVKVGGSYRTTEEAVLRFIRLTQNSSDGVPATDDPPESSGHAEAAAGLDAAGY